MTAFALRLPPFAAPAPLRRRETGTLLPTALFILFLAYTFIGVAPMQEASPDARVGGNVADRLATLMLAGLALAVLAMRARTTLRLLGRTKLVWMMVGWVTASLLWSQFPDQTLRRAISIDLVTLVCLAIAIGCDDLRRLHTILVAALAVVILANLAALAANPGFAVTDIGVRGIYQQKNQAGLVAMVAVIAALYWTVPRRDVVGIAFGLATAGLAFGFLLLTRSKTSIALAVVAGLLLPGLSALRRLGAGRAGVLAVLGCIALTVAALFYAAAGASWIALVSGGGDGSFTGRTEIWKFALAEIAQRPWLGTGYGAFWDVGVENDPLLRAPPGEWLAQVKIGVINQAHNGFLDLLLQGGIPALVLALLIWGQATGRLVGRLFAPAGSDGTRHVSMMFLVIMGIFLFHNITETSIWARGQMLASLTILITFVAAREAGPAGKRGSEP